MPYGVEEEKELLRVWSTTALPGHIIASAFGRTTDSVYSHLAQLRLGGHRYKPEVTELTQKVIDRRENTKKIFQFSPVVICVTSHFSTRDQK